MTVQSVHLIPHFRFERLPTELQHDIFSRLDYQSLIALSSVNSYLHKIVDPQIAASENKFAFVMQAESYFSRHFQTTNNPGNFACYACYRVRDPCHFDRDQPHTIFVDATSGRRVDKVLDSEMGKGNRPPRPPKMMTLRRFCIECGVKEGLHRPGDLLITKLEQKLWVCKCRRVWQMTSRLKCGMCDSDCPLSARKMW